MFGKIRQNSEIIEGGMGGGGQKAKFTPKIKNNRLDAFEIRFRHSTSCLELNAKFCPLISTRVQQLS